MDGQRQQKRTARRCLRALLVVMLAVGVVGAARQALFERRSAQDQQVAAQQAGGLPQATQMPAAAPPALPTATPAPPDDAPAAAAPELMEPQRAPVVSTLDPVAAELMRIDLAALQESNPDVKGWIYIPGTKLNYPLLRGTDNEYYLKNTWQHRKSAVGSIFMDCANRSDLADFNTVVYGHRMRSGSMFGSLKHYKDPDYLAEHPYVYVRTADGVHKYAIFAAYETGTDAMLYRPVLRKPENRETLLSDAREKNRLPNELSPGITDHILTMVTCTSSDSDSRWVVQAVAVTE